MHFLTEKLQTDKNVLFIGKADFEVFSEKIGTNSTNVHTGGRNCLQQEKLTLTNLL